MTKETKGRIGVHISDLGLGKIAAGKLKKFEGKRVYFRKRDNKARDLRMIKIDRAILKEKHRGMSKHEIRRIARKAGCSYSYAYYVIYSKGRG